MKSEPSDYIVDLTAIYARLREAQTKQKDAGEFASSVRIGNHEYKLNLLEFDFTRTPPVRLGLRIAGVRLCQYVPPGPPGIATKGSMLAKLIHLSQEILASETPYIGDFNIPLDTPMLDVNQQDVLCRVFEDLALSGQENVLNGGNTIRMTQLDTLGRRRLGFPGFVVGAEKNDDEYIGAMLSHASHFDRCYRSPGAKGFYGPRLSASAFERCKGLLWNDVFLQELKETRARDEKGSYTNINRFWTKLSERLCTEAHVSWEEMVCLLFEEDHVRIEFSLPQKNVYRQAL